MARLALTVAGAVIGALLALPTGGMSVAMGMQLGILAGSLAGALIFPGKGTHTYGPRLNDMQISSSAPGAVIPLLYGSMRLGGNIIWATKIKETTTTTSQSAKGGPTVKQTTYSYSISFAAAFCQGPATISRIWGDAKLIYDTTGNKNLGPWSSSTNYVTGDVVSRNGHWYKAKTSNTNEDPEGAGVFGSLLGQLFWEPTAAPSTSTSAIAKNIHVVPTFYRGTETQLPDPLMVSHDGAAKTPGYRGVCYAVVEDFPLEDFGNRLPNIRAEVNSLAVTNYPAYSFDKANIPDPDNGNAVEVQWLEPWIVDRTRQVGYCISTRARVIQRVNLITNAIEAQGLVDASLYGLREDVDYNAVLTQAHNITIDGDGFLWIGFISTMYKHDDRTAHAGDLGDPYDRTTFGAATNYWLKKIDPYTFKAVAQIQLNNSQGVQRPDPASYPGYGLACAYGRYLLAGCYDFHTNTAGLFVYDTAVLDLVGYSPISDGSWYGASSGYPLHDPETNIVYVLSFVGNSSIPGSGDYATITRVNLNGGVTHFVSDAPRYIDVYSWSVPWSAADGVAMVGWLDPTDKTILMLTNVGKLLKFDTATGAVIDSIGDIDNHVAEINKVSGVSTQPFELLGGYPGWQSGQNYGTLDTGVLWLPGPGFGQSSAAQAFVWSVFIAGAMSHLDPDFVDPSSNGTVQATQGEVQSFITYLAANPSVNDSLTASLQNNYWFLDMLAQATLASDASLKDAAVWLNAHWTDQVATTAMYVFRSFRTSDLSVIASYNTKNFISGFNLGEVTFGNVGFAFDPNSNSVLAPGYTLNKAYHFYLDRLGNNGIGCDEIVLDVCEKAGLDPSRVDVSAIAGIAVQGYPVTSLQSGKDIITALAQYGFFEGRETDFTLSFVPRGQESVLTIPESDLGLAQDKAELTETIGQEQDTPKTVEVLHIDPAQDYQQGQQVKVRHSRTTASLNKTSISLPIVMSSLQAAQLADRIIWTAENERRAYKTSLYKASYMLLDPGDVVNFVYNGLTLAGRVSGSMIGQNFATALEITSEDSNNYLSTAAGTDNDGFQGQTLTGLAASLLWLFDMPYLSDTDADASGNLGYYFAMNPQGSGTWGAGALYSSTDNMSFSQVGASATGLTYGIAQNVLGAPRSPFTWDNDNTLTVNLLNGTAPASDTEFNVLNGANAAILYPSLEVIQFTTVTLNLDGTYTLSGLLRGRRGTEWAAHATSHAAGEFVVFPLSGGMVHEQVSLAAFNQQRFYKGVTVGSDLNSATSKPLTLIGRDLMPYAPAQFGGVKSGSDIILTWERRTRLGGDPWYNGTNTVPLNEDSEGYDVEILSAAGGTVKRTFSGLTSPTVTYTSAQQTTDFGSTQSDIAARVYQVSAQVGRGFPTENDHCLTGMAVSGG